MAEDHDQDSGTHQRLARIALKQVRVPREDPSKAASKDKNRLVPYLDLFARLDDEELARLGGVERSAVAELREQVDEVCNALARYVDLLPRLGDEELVRLTGASGKTIQFWRLCVGRDASVAGTNPLRTRSDVMTPVPQPVPDDVPTQPVAIPAPTAREATPVPFPETPEDASLTAEPEPDVPPMPQLSPKPPPPPRPKRSDAVEFAGGLLVDDDDEDIAPIEL